MAASVKQINLLPAGCQPWNKDVCTASGDCFAYCATLAIYIYQLNPTTNKFQLRTIMSEHKKTITSIAFSTHDLDLLASAGTDLQVIIYSVSRQCVVAKLDNLRTAPFSIAWCPHERDSLSFISGKGPLHVWNYACPTPQAMNAHRDVQNFMSNVCQIRWHHSVMQKLVCGHNDGSISVFTPGCRAQRHVLRPENFEGTDEEDPVTAVEWDPLSNDYLLLSSTHNGVRLIDTSSLSVIMSFSLPSAAAQVHTLAWLHQAPGMFVTGDAHSGVLRLWNVSKSSPIENLRLKKTGFHALHVFSSSPQVDQQETALSGTKRGSLPPSLNASSRFALPPAHAVCTFLDGGVGLYDLGKRRWNFLRDQGHVETIFDCKFKPDDCDQLATGSFDGTIKIWDVNTLQAINSSPGNEGVIYCLSWAPADLNCIAASTSRNGVFIWDVSKGKIISRFNEHGKNPVYCVAWNHKDSRRIASAGGDGNCIVRQVDGKVLMKYKHPGAVFGCDWNPHNKDMLATGCDDKNVRVYYLATSNDQPLKVFSGHKSKVFHIRWSPLREGILCSGSDDCTIRLWDYTQECCCMVLQGHTGPVRGLLWNSEIPYLLVSGSWDYSIRVWDTRDGACIETVLDHGADVYGVTSHPQRPFSIASSSRDSTVRIWSLTPLVQPLEISILAERPWDQVLISPVLGKEHANALGTLPILVGKESRDLKLSIEKSPGDGRQQTLRCFSKFFLSSSGISNLWELVAIICGLEENLLSESYSRGIMHHSHICKYRASAAQELEMVKISKFGAGLGAPSREERLREAASIHLKLGNLQRYCELLLELGEWEKALCVAPGVSLEFWRKLTKQRAEVLLAEDSDDAVPFCVASGETERLVHHFSRHGQLQDAFLTATAAHEGSIIAPVNPVKGGRRASQNGQQEDKSAEHLLMDTGRQLAEGYFSSGAPVQAACCHLAIDDVKGAICRLLRGSEYELAASVSLVLKSFPDLTNFAIEYLSRRCERLGQWELGIDVLKACVHQPAQLLSRLCARCAASMAEINHLHSKAGLPMMDACLEQAQDAEYRLGRMKEHETGDVLQCVQLFLLSTHPHLGLKHGIEHVRQQMSSADWRAEDSWGLIQMMSCMRTEKLQHQKCTQLRNELLLLSAYVGTLLAIRRKYCSIVLPLFRHTLELMKQEVWDLPSLSSSLVTSEMDAWLAHQAGKPPDNNAVYTELMHKVGTEPTSLEVGEDFVGSSHLPSHSDVHVSILTQHRIQGPAYFLEDGQSTLSISDAMMWAKVNAFSPLGSGVRINPF